LDINYAQLLSYAQEKIKGAHTKEKITTLVYAKQGIKVSHTSCEAGIPCLVSYPFCVPYP